MRPVLAALLLAAAAARAEEPKPLPKNIVLADLGLHVVGLGFQRTLTDHLAAQLSFNLWVPWTMNQNFLGLADTEDKGNVAGVVGRVRLFVYPEGRAPIGPWLSPFFQFGLTNETRPFDPMVVRGQTLATGAAVGWSWLFLGRIHLALGLGIQYHLGPFFSRLSTHADINLGFAF